MRRRIGRLPRRINNDLHHFKRTVELTSIQCAVASNVSIDTLGAMQFTLSQLPGVSEFTTLFDMYKINGIKLSFVPAQTGADTNDPSKFMYMPDFWTVIDYDDANTPTKNDMLQCTGLRMTRGNRTHSRYIKPAVSAEVYRSLTNSSYAPKWRQWLDMADTGVPHYGIKYFAHASGYTSGNQPAWRVYATFYFSCKGVR